MNDDAASGDDALGISRQAIRALIAGRSALDNERLDVASGRDAEAFLRSYGFDYQDPVQRRELQEIRRAALEFLEQELLLPGMEVLGDVVRMQDVRTLLAWASSRDGSDRQRWSCALLRVIHTCAHAHSYSDMAHGHRVRASIEARFAPHLFTTNGVTTLGQGEAAVELVRFELRPPKTFRSVVIKLLSAAHNVGTEVYDRQGVRIVTRDRIDALMVLRYLRSEHVVMFANVMPDRCRNTLIDPDWYDAEMDRIGEAARTMSRAQLLAQLRKAAAEHTVDRTSSEHNPNSSDAYRSIQFTCREMLRIDPMGSLPGGRFFFPYEVQILDAESAEVAKSGPASHSAYRARQLARARRRVLGRLIPAGALRE